MTKRNRTERELSKYYSKEVIDRIVKARAGPLPDILRKGSAHNDRTKYRRKPKHGTHTEQNDTE